MAVRIRVRGDSTTEMDVMKVIMQRLSISEEDIRVVKKDGKDFIIKASIENTSRIAEKLRVKRWSVSHVAEEFTTRSVTEGNDDSDDIVFITVYYSFCLLGGEEHIDLTSIAKSIQGQFIERGGKFFIKVYDTKCCYVTVNGDGPQPPPNNNVVNIEFKGKKIDATHAKQICDIISKELKLKKDQEYIFLQNFYGVSTIYPAENNDD